MSINNKLLEDELSAFCMSDSLSEDGLREIVQQHTPNTNDPADRKYHFFLAACYNERVTEGILRYLLEYFPNAVRFQGALGTSIHSICNNKNVTLGMVQLLIDAFPDSLRRENISGCTPLHVLCLKEPLDEDVGLEILKLILQKSPESVRHAAGNDNLPIQSAAAFQSPEFCRILIEAYPRSERMANNDGKLPFHAACNYGTVATAKYFYQLYPESINVADDNGWYPIYYAISGIKVNPANAIDMVQFLLDCDPSVALQNWHGFLPIYWICVRSSIENTPQLNARLKVLQLLYDVHPHLIESDEIESNVTTFHPKIQTFINSQLTYARQARDLRQMNTPDENGQLPLHKALFDNVTLGSIKLLVKGYQSAISCADNKGMIPLHVACQHNETPGIVEYLVSLIELTLGTTDGEGNTALHHACIGANHAIIALLIDKYGSISVAKRNEHRQLPIDLLFESEAVSDRESVEYIESIYRLLRAYPMNLMHYDFGKAGSRDSISQNEKKRKIDEV